MTTPWIAFLQEQGATLNTLHCSFRSDREDTALAESTTLLIPLTHLGLIQATGEEAASFLHNLGSNEVKKLPLDRAQHNSLNSPKGRMLASFIIWRSESAYLMTVSADIQAAILKKLSMYVLRAKVKLSDAGQDRVLLGLSGPQARSALLAIGLEASTDPLGVTQGETRCIHLDHERFILDCPADQAPELWTKLIASGAQAAGTAAWRWLDIRDGLPMITAQTQDEFVAQMLNFELIGGVNFTKGCYPGQEIVARTQYLGKLKKRMYRAHVHEDGELAAVGADLYAPEFGTQSCGKLVSVVASPKGGADLLAVMQIAAFEAGEVHLASPEGPHLSLGQLPYAID